MSGEKLSISAGIRAQAEVDLESKSRVEMDPQGHREENGVEFDPEQHPHYNLDSVDVSPRVELGLTISPHTHSGHATVAMAKTYDLRVALAWQPQRLGAEGQSVLPDILSSSDQSASELLQRGRWGLSITGSTVRDVTTFTQVGAQRYSPVLAGVPGHPNITLAELEDFGARFSQEVSTGGVQYVGDENGDYVRSSLDRYTLLSEYDLLRDGNGDVILRSGQPVFANVPSHGNVTRAELIGKGAMYSQEDVPAGQIVYTYDPNGDYVLFEDTYHHIGSFEHKTKEDKDGNKTDEVIYKKHDGGSHLKGADGKYYEKDTVEGLPTKARFKVKHEPKTVVGEFGLNVDVSRNTLVSSGDSEIATGEMPFYTDTDNNGLSQAATRSDMLLHVRLTGAAKIYPFQSAGFGLIAGAFVEGNFGLGNDPFQLSLNGNSLDLFNQSANGAVSGAGTWLTSSVGGGLFVGAFIDSRKTPSQPSEEVLAVPDPTAAAAPAPATTP